MSKALHRFLQTLSIGYGKNMPARLTSSVQSMLVDELASGHHNDCFIAPSTDYQYQQHMHLMMKSSNHQEPGEATVQPDPHASSRTKSVKRRAAEALLAARYGSTCSHHVALVQEPTTHAASGLQRMFSAGSRTQSAETGPESSPSDRDEDSSMTAMCNILNPRLSSAKIPRVDSNSVRHGTGSTVTPSTHRQFAPVKNHPHVTTEAHKGFGQKAIQPQKTPSILVKGKDMTSSGTGQQQAATAMSPPSTLQAALNAAAKQDRRSAAERELSSIMSEAATAAAIAAAEQRQQTPVSSDSTSTEGPSQFDADAIITTEHHQRLRNSPRPVAECGPDCSTHALHFCDHAVSLPSVDWFKAFTSDPDKFAINRIAVGYEKLSMGEGLTAYYVYDAKWAEDAVRQLRASMVDQVLGIDLEWQPDRGHGQSNPVAVIQIASATTCLILHTSVMRYSLPPAVRELLTDPAVRLVGFSWDTSDEVKFQKTFRMGKGEFHNFCDLVDVAKVMGWRGMGLDRLTKQVLGFGLNKSKKVSRSNWAAKKLDRRQLKYAAMDAFATAQVFRGLRLWHSSPEPCAGCKHPIGAILTDVSLVCKLTSRQYHDVRAYQRSCEINNVPVDIHECQECGRVVTKAHTSSKSSGGNRSIEASVVMESVGLA